MILTNLLRGLLAALIGVSVLAGQEDKLWVRHSDSFKYDRYRNEEVKHLKGRVQIEYDSVTVYTDEMRDYLHRRQVDFLGNVRVFYRNKRLWADQAVYDKDRKEMTCRAAGDSMVRLEDPGEGITVTGRWLVYFETQDSAVMKREPVFADADSDGRDTLRITGAVMEYSGRSRQARALGNVVITRGDLRAVCGRAVFFRAEDRILLRQAPVVTTPDSRLEGVEIEMRLADRRLQEVVVMDSARGIYTEHEPDSAVQISELDGDTIRSFFQNDTMREAWVLHHASGRCFTRDLPDQVNTLDGERIDLFFSRNLVDYILVKDRAESLYFFEEQGRGGRGKNRATGDTIRIDFEQGRVSWVNIKGGVHGRYFFLD